MIAHILYPLIMPIHKKFYSHTTSRQHILDMTQPLCIHTYQFFTTYKKMITVLSEDQNSVQNPVIVVNFIY